jgi:hypothetical protein
MKASLSHLKTFDRYLLQKQAVQVLLQPSFFMRMQPEYCCLCAGFLQLSGPKRPI